MDDFFETISKYSTRILASMIFGITAVVLINPVTSGGKILLYILATTLFLLAVALLRAIGKVIRR